MTSSKKKKTQDIERKTDILKSLRLEIEPENVFCGQEKDVFDYFVEKNAKIILENLESDHEEGLEIGRISWTEISVAQMHENGESLFSVFDAVSQEMYELYHALFDPENDEFKDNTIGTYYDMITGDLLYVQVIKILPEYRTCKIPQQVLSYLIERFRTECGAVVLIPHPIDVGTSSQKLSEFDKKMKYDLFSNDKVAVNKKLTDYYSKMGFKRVKGTEYMIFSLASCFDEPTF